MFANIFTPADLQTVFTCEYVIVFEDTIVFAAGEVVLFAAATGELVFRQLWVLRKSGSP
jgi:hypothetical protein